MGQYSDRYHLEKCKGDWIEVDWLHFEVSDLAAFGFSNRLVLWTKSLRQNPEPSWKKGLLEKFCQSLFKALTKTPFCYGKTIAQWGAVKAC
jgi:hypothetical protein